MTKLGTGSSAREGLGAFRAERSLREAYILDSSQYISRHQCVNANGETDQEGEGKLTSSAPPRWLLLWRSGPAELEVVRPPVGREGSERL